MAVLHTDPLNGLVIITADLRIWSGGVKLTREEDLSSVKDKLPPTGMVTDGRKNLVKPKALAPFHAIRKRLERLLVRTGFRLMADAWAVPESEISSIVSEIEDLEKEFNDEIPLLAAALPSHYQEQADEYPEWKEQLKKGELSAVDVTSRMKFNVGIYKIAPPAADSSASGINRRYNDVVNSAVPALMNDIADKAKSLLKGPVGTKLVCTQTQHTQVKKLVERLQVFSFLDHRVGPTADALESMLSCIPLTGPLNPGNTAVLRVVAEQLSIPETALQELEDDGTESDAQQPLANTQAPSSAPPAAAIPTHAVGF